MSGGAQLGFLMAMLAVGVGWNLTYSGGSAMIAASYRPAERGSVQPIAEAVAGGFQVAGSLSAGMAASAGGWHVLGIVLFGVSMIVMVASLVLRKCTFVDSLRTFLQL
jgi:hypothetical protein